MDPASSRRLKEGLSTVTRGTLFLLVATLLFVLLNFAARVVVTRWLSPAEWSAFSWSLTLTGFLAAFGTLGLPSALARSLPYALSDSERRSMVRAALWLGSAAGFGTAVILFLVGPSIGARLGSPLIGIALPYLGIAAGAQIAAGLIASIFQGYEDVRPNGLILQIITPGLFFAFLFVALLQPAGLGIHQALLAYAVANVLGLGLTIAYLARRLPRRLPSGPRAPAAVPKLLMFAAPLFAAGILSSLTTNGDTIVLGVYFPISVGSYSASLTLARLLQVGIGATAYILLPVTTRFVRAEDTGSIRLIYATLTKWLLLFSLPLFVLFAFLPGLSLGFVYGSHYGSIIAPLEITVAGGFLATLFGPGPATQVALGQTRLVMYNSLASAAADVGLALLLVPAYGAVGAAIAWATATSLASGLSLIELAYLHQIHPFRRHSVLPLLATGVPVGIALLLLRGMIAFWMLPVIGLAVAGLFVVVVIASRSIDLGDRLMLEVVERLLGRPIPFVRRLGRLALRTAPLTP